MIKTRTKSRSGIGKTTQRSKSAAMRKAQKLAKARYRRSLAAAKDNRPAQAWFEQTDCPFIPTKE